MLWCRLLGHRFRFGADGATMRWRCERGCGAGGEKRYSTVAEAERYARGFERERAGTAGETALGALPLRLLRSIRGRGGGA
jgi:hypothetical protein